MVILGIDPGTHRVGYGVIKKTGSSLSFVEAGLLNIATGPRRLPTIEESLKELLNRTLPDRVGIEKLFFTKNQKTAIAVAQARGVLLNTVMKHGTPFVELTPSEIKLAVAGNGRAEKQSVARMVFRFLNIPPLRSPDDVTDALAIAIAVSSRHIDI